MVCVAPNVDMAACLQAIEVRWNGEEISPDLSRVGSARPTGLGRAWPTTKVVVPMCLMEVHGADPGENCCFWLVTRADDGDTYATFPL